MTCSIVSHFIGRTVGGLDHIVHDASWGCLLKWGVPYIYTSKQRQIWHTLVCLMHRCIPGFIPVCNMVQFHTTMQLECYVSVCLFIHTCKAGNTPEHMVPLGKPRRTESVLANQTLHRTLDLYEHAFNPDKYAVVGMLRCASLWWTNSWWIRSCSTWGKLRLFATVWFSMYTSVQKQIWCTLIYQILRCIPGLTTVCNFSA